MTVCFFLARIPARHSGRYEAFRPNHWLTLRVIDCDKGRVCLTESEKVCICTEPERVLGRVEIAGYPKFSNGCGHHNRVDFSTPPRECY